MIHAAEYEMEKDDLIVHPVIQIAFRVNMTFLCERFSAMRSEKCIIKSAMSVHEAYAEMTFQGLGIFPTLEQL